MKVGALILTLAAVTITSACDKSTAWPPNNAQLVRVFEQQQDTFVLIEREMTSDDLQRMGSGILSEIARNPALAELPSGQVSKYTALFDRMQMFLHVTRRDDSTEFELLIQNVGPRLYLSRFVHTAARVSMPVCAPAMQQMACGACAIDLERNWLLAYSWFPANPEAEAREC